MDEPRKHAIQRRKSVTKDHILFDPIYMKMSRTGKSREIESRLVVSRAWKPELTEKSQGKLGVDLRNSLNLLKTIELYAGNG